MPGDGYQIAENRTGSGLSTGASTIEHERAGRLRLNEDRIEGAVHSTQRVLSRQHRGVHPHRDAFALTVGDLLADREQLHHVDPTHEQRPHRWR